MSAAATRERRKTAGHRMTTLVGKAQEEDDAFWGHDTWAEDDSGNDSFRDSDEDSAARKDQFDSDFDDSESDNEQEEAEAGEKEERELQRLEKAKRQKKSNYIDVAKGGRTMLQKAKGVRGKGSKRLMGNGINAGLVLNLPPPTTPSIGEASATIHNAQSQVHSQAPISTPIPVPSTPMPPATAATKQVKSPKPTKTTQQQQPTLASARQRRSQTKKRDTRNTQPTYSDTASHAANNNNNNNNNSTYAQHNQKRLKTSRSAGAGSKKSKRRQFLQEELLLEAVKETEAENQRWLLARKRVQDSADQDTDAFSALRDKHRGKNVIQKYHSRRGCLITLTFPEMDAVPEILKRKKELPMKPTPVFCAISGRPARYRDPKTGLGYFDAAAFKELRRRHDAGEKIDQHTKVKRKLEPTKVASPASPGNGSSSFDANNDRKTQKMNSNNTCTTKQTPKSPGSDGFILNLGGDKKSPGGTRSSGRKWKPSQKMLQGLGDKLDGKNHEEKSSDLNNSKSDPIIERAPPLPSIAPKKTAEAFAEKVSTPKVVDSKQAQKATAAPSETQSEEAQKAATKAIDNDQRTASSRTSQEESFGAVIESTSVVRPSSSEQIYIIPAESPDKASNQPRYMTQSELIMQAINTYNRSQDSKVAKKKSDENGEALPKK